MRTDRGRDIGRRLSRLRDDGSIDSRTRKREREGGRDKKKLVEDQKADGAAKRER